MNGAVVSLIFCLRDGPDLQKCMPVNVEGGAIAADGLLPHDGKEKKPAQRKPVAKPKPEVVIEISSGSAEVKAEKNKKRNGVGSLGKKTPTLTSTLSARSKVSLYSFNPDSLGDMKVGGPHLILLYVCRLHVV